MRLERGLRWSIYVTIATLFTTGIAWWVDDVPGPARLYLIATHGLAAMLFLVALGAIVVLHVREGWRRRRNRWSGAIMLTAVGLLAITAFGLYYVGSEGLRDAGSTLHLAVGLALPLILAVHVALGVRTRHTLDDDEDDG